MSVGSGLRDPVLLIGNASSTSVLDDAEAFTILTVRVDANLDGNHRLTRRAGDRERHRLSDALVPGGTE